MSFQIETGRLIIRDIREDDIPVLLAQFAEPESRANILSFQADEDYNRMDLATAIAWAKHPQRLYYKLAVALKKGGDLIGSCTIAKVRPNCFETSIGWHYGHEYRGNGYATEAARRLLYIGFALNNVSKIYADAFAENRASIRIFEKIGMSPHLNFGFFNMLRGWDYGERKPAVRYTISRQEWLAQENKRESLGEKDKI
jgi:ribosomal-protein-alanine N-acetyltransferase